MPKNGTKWDKRRIAKDRIKELFRQAEIRFKESQALSDRYVILAKKIAMRYRVAIPKELKRRFCKQCNKYLVPGINCRVRLYKKRRICFCFNCKNYTRIPYK